MNEQNNYIVIDNKETISLEDLQIYFEESEKNDRVVALNNLLIKTFNLDGCTTLNEKDTKKYLTKLLKNEIYINKHFDNNKNNMYDEFYDAASKSLSDYSYLTAIDNINSLLSKLASYLVDVSNFYSKNIIDGLNDKFLNTFKDIMSNIDIKPVDSEIIDKNVEKLISYNWVVSFEIEDYVSGNVKSKTQMVEIITKYYTKNRIKTISRDMSEKLKFDKNLSRYFREASRCYKNKCYYSCASMMFAIIDRLISMTFNKKPGIRDIKSLHKKLKTEEYYNLYVNYSTVKVLYDIYKETNDFSLPTKKLNRNMIIHGWAKRSVKPYECLQLLLIVKNLVFILNYELGILNVS